MDMIGKLNIDCGMSDRRIRPQVVEMCQIIGDLDMDNAAIC